MHCADGTGLKVVCLILRLACQASLCSPRDLGWDSSGFASNFEFGTCGSCCEWRERLLAKIYRYFEETLKGLPRRYHPFYEKYDWPLEMLPRAKSLLKLFVMEPTTVSGTPIWMCNQTPDQVSVKKSSKHESVAHNHHTMLARCSNPHRPGHPVSGIDEWYQKRTESE